MDTFAGEHQIQERLFRLPTQKNVANKDEDFRQKGCLQRVDGFSAGRHCCVDVILNGVDSFYASIVIEVL